MKKALIIFTSLGAVGAAGYFFYKEQYNRLLNMQYQVIGIKANSLSVSKTDLDLKIKIISEAVLEATITDLNLDVFLNGRKLGVVSSESPILIPAKGYSIADLKVVINLTDVVFDAVNLAKELYASKDGKITLKGTAAVKTGPVKIKSAPIDYTESIKYLMS